MFQADKKPILFNKELTGNPITFNSRLKNMPLSKCEITIPITQQGSGTPSPDNIREFIPVSGVNIGQTSGYASYFKGLLNGTYGFVDLGSLSWTRSTLRDISYFRSSALSLAKAGVIFSKSNIIDPRHTTVVTRGVAELTSDKTMFMWTDKTLFIRDDNYTDASTFKTAMSGVYLIYELAEPSTPVTPEQFATLCQAFGITGNTYQIAFGQTVYSANLDVLTGKLYATHILDLFDGSEDENWTVYGTGTENFFYRCPTSQTAVNGKPSCNRFTPESIFPEGTRLGVYVYNSQVRIRTDNELSLTDWKAFLSSNNVQVVYELATPIQIPLGGYLIEAFKGENNLISSVGTITAKIVEVK